MKKIFLLAVLFLATLNFSCSDYFDQVPKDRLTFEEVFDSRESTSKYLATVYTYIPDEFKQRNPGEGEGQGTSGAWVTGCDEADCAWTNNPSNDINRNLLTPQTDIVKVYWRKFYQGINTASIFMQNAHRCKELTPDLLNQWVTEARALRAIYYYYLFRLYGPIVLHGEEPVNQEAPADQLQFSRSSIDECVDFIVSEFDKVLKSGHLADKITVTDDYGHIDNSIVMAFKEHTLLLAASPLFNGSNTYFTNLSNKDGKKLFPQNLSDAEKTARWKKAADACREFINKYVPGQYDLYKVYTDGKYDAYKSYRDCTRGDDFNSNKEMIFYRIACNTSFMQYDRTPYHSDARNRDYKGGGAFDVSQDQVDAYLMANGKAPITGYKEDGSPIINPESGYQDTGMSTGQYNDPATGSFMAPKGVCNAWVNREPRFYADITFNGQRWLNTKDGEVYSTFNYSGNSGIRAGSHDHSSTGYVIRKYAPLGNWDVGGRVCILFRLGQLYLDYAEALNECEPGQPDILKYLNLIRERAGVPLYGSAGLPVPAGQESMREAIRAERRIEMAFENCRYFDVRRWNIAMETENRPLRGMNINEDGDKFYVRTILEERKFTPKAYFFPIPQNEIDIDKNLVQNPGWSAVD